VVDIVHGAIDGVDYPGWVICQGHHSGLRLWSSLFGNETAREMEKYLEKGYLLLVILSFTTNKIWIFLINKTSRTISYE